MKEKNIWRQLIIGLVWTFLAGCWSQAVLASPTPPVNIVREDIIDGKVTAYIPRISGLADKNIEARLNGEIRRPVENGRKQFTANLARLDDSPIPENIKKAALYWATYSVKLNKNDLLSLTITEYAFTGGAHGSTDMYALNMNTRDGRIYTLADIFRPGTAYKERLESIIREEMARTNKTHYRFEGVSDDQKFYLTEEGLVLYFVPYEIASWAEGYIRFVIPYRDISDIKDEALPLY